MPVSGITLTRLREDCNFPSAEKIGRDHYYDKSEILNWVKTRCSNHAAFLDTDKILTSSEVAALLNRSPAWIWEHLVKSSSITRINLSPNVESKNRKNYFIEREILEQFQTLIEIESDRREAA